jgi:hypothetical protein
VVRGTKQRVFDEVRVPVIRWRSTVLRADPPSPRKAALVREGAERIGVRACH